MGSPMISIFLVFCACLALAQAQQPTSFNFDKIRYTFYPGDIARTWPEANAFCKSVGKELAVFANRGQIRNVSEYLSPEGGVWTGYKTNGDGKFESVELAEFEWKKEFGTPLLNKAKPKQCGLLSVANYTGIVATDCNTKKSALCSISDPDAIAAETMLDEKTAANKSPAEAKPAAAAKSPAKSSVVSTPSKSSNTTKAAAPSPKPASSKPAAVKKPDVKPEKSAVDKDTEDKDADKSKSEKTPKATPKSTEKKPSAESKPTDDSYNKTKSDSKDGKAKSDSKDEKSKSDPKDDKAKDSKDDKAKSDSKDAKPKPATKAAESKPVEKKGNAAAEKKTEDEDADAEPETPKPTTKPPTNQTPIQIESEGSRFTFFPNHIMFGGYMEYSRFCEDKGLQPAVFKSRSQLDDIASHVNSVVMVWTGYTTDSQGNMHSVDEVNGPWQPEFDATGTGASQSLMCGALSTAANKVGVTLNSCASAHEALCSAKTFAKKNGKK